MEVSGNGMVAAYIHTGAKVGVLVEVGAGKEATVANDDFKQLVRDITLQIAAGHPSAVSRDQVDPPVLAKEKEIAAEQVKNKPAQAIAKIVEGKLEKFYQTIACSIRASSSATPKSPSKSTSPQSRSSSGTRLRFAASSLPSRRVLLIRALLGNFGMRRPCL